jgi:hypothetical protein
MNPRVIVGIVAVVGTAACGLFGAIANRNGDEAT